MKSISKLFFASILLLSLSFTACNQKANTSPIEKEVLIDIPEMNEREGKLATVEEWPKIWEKAQNLHQKVRYNGDAKSALYLAALYMQEARITGDHPYYYNAALDVLDFVIENPPKEKILQYQALASKGSVLLSQHQFEEALKVGNKGLKLETKDAQIYGVLCDANLELGNYEKALEMGDKMVSIKPDLRSYARVSYLRELHGDFEGAIDAMKLAVAAGVPGHENTAWARHQLAKIYLEYGNEKKALIELEKCLVERPTYAFAMESLAIIDLEKGNYKQALKTINKACELMPEFSFYVCKAKIEKARGEIDSYKKIRDELLVMMQEDTESGHNMSLETARIHLELFDNGDDALNAALPEYKIRPQNHEVNKIMGEIYFQLGKYDKAVDHLQVATQINWESPSLLCYYGMALVKSGETEKGKKVIKNALKFSNSLNKELLIQSNACLKS